LLAKVIAWGHDRTEAIARMRRALAEFCLDGLATTLPYQRALLEDPRFQQGDVSTDFVAQHVREVLGDGKSPRDDTEGSSRG
jgi:biotin carboxylase